ncbi:MAG: Asp-tRNA(Asn)/Glu-tRNA(Gln) amidotransferase subunit GatB, partial [Thermomicrobiales bacterium]|nr:Asp-tRNA(Asn)/Glu-tRNA(Gln) amidotransferase subunit GatB [Thermomicrobiales bacterium]
MEFETIIGLEVHVQVATNSKMFCGCSSDYPSAPPNTHVCPICLGMPGVLPVINREAVRKTIMTGLALGAEIPQFNKFDRKNYIYPDLMKGYQVSQYDLPMALGGQVDIEVDGETRRVGITRVHLEEDTARLSHGSGYSLVDVNRSGVPLMEIVSEPDLRSPQEARELLIELRRILRYIGASNANMEEGQFRCDANISQRTTDGSVVGAKVEIKNMNSFRAVERALRFEEVRQREAVAAGETLAQETRGWNEARGVTLSQRTKEQAHDYRYFPEPDLPPLTVDDPMRERVRASLPELPAARYQRFVSDFALNGADAAILTNERPIADVFEAAVANVDEPEAYQATANWIVNDIMGLARSRSMAVDELPLAPDQIQELVSLVRSGK